MNTITYRLAGDPETVTRMERYEDPEVAEVREAELRAAGARGVSNTYRGPCSTCGRPTTDRTGADICDPCYRRQRHELVGEEFTART